MQVCNSVFMDGKGPGGGGGGGGGGVGMVREVCVVGGWGSVKMCNFVYGWKGAWGGGGGWEW